MLIEKDEKTKKDLISKKNKLRPKFGKMKMQRSRKHDIVRTEVVKEIDPERLAFIQYLGHISEEEGEPNTQ